MIKIDGSHGEGGGQILRTSIALSALTGTEAQIDNIRANRPKPGLAPQHLTAIKALKEICNADVEGLKVGETSILFEPNEISHGDYSFDVGTAGSVSLVLQGILPVLALTPGESNIKITGGTDVKWSPPVDYLRFVLFPVLRKMGINVWMDVVDRGYFPKGGGTIEVYIEGTPELDPIVMHGNNKPAIKGMINITGLNKGIAERIRASAMKELSKKKYEADIQIDIRSAGASQGVGMTVWVDTRSSCIGTSILGDKGMSSEEVGKHAVQELISDISKGTGLDIHATDQILPFMAYAPGSSISVRELSEHARTNIRVIEQFLGEKIETESSNGRWIVRSK